VERPYGDKPTASSHDGSLHTASQPQIAKPATLQATQATSIHDKICHGNNGSAWNAIFAPSNLPQNIQAKLNDALVKALDDEATSKRLLQIGSMIPDKKDRTPEALRQFVESEVARWSSVLKAPGATAN
jgi:hypothetical protein